MNDTFEAFLGVGVIALIITGVMLLFMDFRHFDNIASRCTKYGYIQNKDIRIRCSVEQKPKDANAQ